MTNEAQEFRIVELARRLANVVRPGVVAEADFPRARVRVKHGEEAEALTDWLPWLTARAGGGGSWWAPEVGEQVVLLSPSGELAQAVVLPALYSDAHPAPSADPDKHLVRYSDGAVVEYDRAAHKLRAELPAGGSAEINAPEGVTITGDVMIEGDVTVQGAVDATGDVEADGAVKAGGDVEAGGKVKAGSNVEDRQGTMVEMRTTYNAHVHGVPPGFVTPPVAPTSRMT